MVSKCYHCLHYFVYIARRKKEVPPHIAAIVNSMICVWIALWSILYRDSQSYIRAYMAQLSSRPYFTIYLLNQFLVPFILDDFHISGI